MKKAAERLPRGIYEKVPGGKVYWIHYTDASGRRHREKAGSLSTAKTLLHTRHTDKLKGKLPELKRAKPVPFSVLIDDAINHSQSENDPYVAHDSELKMKYVREVFGNLTAESITRQQLISWLDSEAADREWKASTYNRWKSALSLVFRVGMDNEKVVRNPLSKVRRKQEANDRVRYLTSEEEAQLVKVLKKDFPAYLPIFLLSADTG